MNDSQQSLAIQDEDCAILFDSPELKKRYTAEQAQGLEIKRNACIMLLSSGWPVEVIARELHLNIRTVNALAARCSEEVAGATKQFGDICLRLGARWMGLARTKEDGASFLQLVTGAGIAVDKGVILQAMGQLDSLAETKEDSDQAAAMAALRRLMSDQAPITDSHSEGQPPITGHSDDYAGSAALDAAPCPLPGSPPSPPLTSLTQTGGEGGPAPGSPGRSPMGPAESGLSTKGPAGLPSP